MTVVIKLGSSLVAGEGGAVQEDVLAARAAEIAQLVHGGERPCIVSSGAIALGLPRLGATVRPRSMAGLQAASALGQGPLQAAWDRALGAHDVPAAQVLLTASDLADRTAYLNARNSLQELLGARAVPVVNENDATGTEEISFGDNDTLAAQLAILLRARLLILLTEVEGVHSREPGLEDAELLADGALTVAAELGGPSALGSGGMQSKVAAARIASSAGIATVIASGRRDGVLAGIVAGEQQGTHFAPHATPDSSYKLWLRHARQPVARLHIDAGAERALRRRGASLLAVGVRSVDGRFEPGDLVELVGEDGSAVGRGVTAIGMSELKTPRRGAEAIHRDRLVLLGD